MQLRVARGIGIAALVFLLVQLGALVLVPTFYAAGYQTVEDPQDPTNSAIYLLAILAVTAVMLAAFRYDLDRVIRFVILSASGLLSWYVFSVVVPGGLALFVSQRTASSVGGLLALGLAVAVPIALWARPEWYVIDAAGVIMGAGAAGLFGISFGLLPVLVLLAALAVYDAVSVYGTEHMLDLAEGVMDLRIPVVLVIPLSSGYSFLSDQPTPETDDSSPGKDQVSVDESPDTAGPSQADVSTPGLPGHDANPDREPEAMGNDIDHPPVQRGAFFIGLGDAVMPAVMTASAAFFSPASSLGIGILPALNLPALSAMIGTFLGLAILLRLVLEGHAHAGLPLLNGGAIGGYLVGSILAGIPVVTAVGL